MKIKICAALLLVFAAGLVFGQAGRGSNLGKVLVIYYSYSTNANTEKVAKIIQGLTGADIYKIETVNPFPDLPYNAFTQWAKAEIEKKNYPAIKESGLDFSRYDCIFIGGPVWWHTTSLPITLFLLRTDFKGKSIVPFGTHLGGTGTYLRDFSNLAKNARVLPGELFYNVATDSRIDAKITQWVKGFKL
jgi:flavodoxin